jgi:hypothetical protein
MSSGTSSFGISPLAIFQAISSGLIWPTYHFAAKLMGATAVRTNKQKCECMILKEGAYSTEIQSKLTRD